MNYIQFKNIINIFFDKKIKILKKSKKKNNNNKIMHFLTFQK
jgi:hypothetical protein